MAKDFLIGFPTLKQRNMGGFLLFSSDDKSMSAQRKDYLSTTTAKVRFFYTLHKILTLAERERLTIVII